MNSKFEYFEKMFEVTKTYSKYGPMSIGICTSKGVVLVALKLKKSELMILESMEKIYEIDQHIGCVLSGLIADGRVLIEKARVQCQNHRINYNEDMPVRSCVQTVSTKVSEFANVKDCTLGRPYAVEMLFAGVCNGVPQLWHMDSSGTYIRYNIKAIGDISKVQKEVDLLKHENIQQMSLDDATSKALKILRKSTKNLEADNLEVLILEPQQKFYKLSKNQISEIM